MGATDKEFDVLRTEFPETISTRVLGKLASAIPVTAMESVVMGWLGITHPEVKEKRFNSRRSGWLFNLTILDLYTTKDGAGLEVMMVHGENFQNNNAFQWDANRPLVARIRGRVSQHALGRGCIPACTGKGVCNSVCTGQGVSAQGVCLCKGVSVQEGGLPRGVFARGVWQTPPGPEVDTPSYGQTDTCENITSTKADQK